ncbi:glycosyltransferase [Streptococcus gallolyticus subsp. gallolyticus]|uniref:glycosyltransferase n=1 Tax=Streptococcus gallolyticus TaxID=315405 RepID=UPI002283C64E|nr:glycosyltransferase [Streptococcus gallolyticus]MCY7152795.1 glycosyltransferase [Streptococcus gallolyticus subsp. gallolyticus]
MKILHYTIGFAPERTGGLVGYATDLMQEQAKQGNDVFALYPASQFLFGKRVGIKKTTTLGKIQRFKLINSLPLALFGGVASPSDFMQSCDPSRYLAFLKNLKPDVIHIHSLIGLHKEFLEVAKKLNIKTVYTTHDYYGLAPLPSFYYNGKSFDESNDNLAWNIMSADALSTKKLRAFQLSFYPTIRKWMKKMNKNPKHKSYQEIDTIDADIDYTELRKYYTSIFSLIDIFHFNSNLACSIYQKNLPFKINGKVISITNKLIREHDVVRTQKEKKTIAFIGPDEDYKGYFEFLDFVSTLNLDKYDIVTYGHVANQFAPSYISQRGRFSQTDLDKVYSGIDILIVPSKWKESFGLVVLEALSYGVIVFASQNIGAKDLLQKEYIFSDLSLLDINLDVQQKNIKIKTLDEHVRELKSLYMSKY